MAGVLWSTKKCIPENELTKKGAPKDQARNMFYNIKDLVGSYSAI